LAFVALMNPQWKRAAGGVAPSGWHIASGVGLGSRRPLIPPQTATGAGGGARRAASGRDGWPGPEGGGLLSHSWDVFPTKRTCAELAGPMGLTNHIYKPANTQANFCRNPAQACGRLPEVLFNCLTSAPTGTASHRLHPPLRSPRLQRCAAGPLRASPAPPPTRAPLLRG